VFLTVDRDAVPHGILHHKHPDLFELFSKLLNIKGYDAVVDVDVGTVVKDVQ
jgi:hypothetical protein